MTYAVRFAAGALREIRALPADTRREVGSVISKLADDPRPAGTKRIADIPDCYRVRAGVFRIVYTVTDRILTVSVVTVGHRKEVYKKLRGKIRSRT